jgi:hypothetical protein
LVRTRQHARRFEKRECRKNSQNSLFSRQLRRIHSRKSVRSIRFFKIHSVFLRSIRLWILRLKIPVKFLGRYPSLVDIVATSMYDKILTSCQRLCAAEPRPAVLRRQRLFRSSVSVASSPAEQLLGRIAQKLLCWRRCYGNAAAEKTLPPEYGGAWLCRTQSLTRGENFVVHGCSHDIDQRWISPQKFDWNFQSKYP